MNEIESLVQQLEKNGNNVFWQGGASDSSVDELQSLLGVRIPTSFRRFLCAFGGGGVVGEEISGIENDNPRLEHRGTVLGDTLICRQTYGLPARLIVIYLGGDGDFAWCLDAEQVSGVECSVVSYEFHSKIIRPLATDFIAFFREYLTLRLSR
jgi:hypothetical protein